MPGNCGNGCAHGPVPSNLRAEGGTRLKSITFRIARLSSAEIAERFGNRLIDRALTLATLPERGRIVPELGEPDLREIIFKSYRIVYRLRAGRVEVIRFWHAARGTSEIDSDEF